MDEVAVVTVFLRHRGEVLLLRRSAEVDSYPGQWGAVTGHISDDTPQTAALREIEEETGLQEQDVTLAKTGLSFPVEDAERGTRWVVHPFLFDCSTREVSLNWETDDSEWVPPTALLRRDTVPELWTAYRRVAPSVVDLSDDTTHGSAYLSVRALEVLRDRAGQLATAEADDVEDARTRVLRTAARLLDARPTMAALANRVHRVLHDAAPDRSPADVESRAHQAIAQALDAEAAAAQAAADVVSDHRVLTLSRSSTVAAALREGTPDSVIVATSHPGGEGIGVAEALAEEEQAVTLLPDAAVAARLAEGDIDLVLVGADTVFPSGALVNKVGTRSVALAAAHEDVPLYATCSVDKVAPSPHRPAEWAERHDVYDGPARLGVWAPRFDTTPGPLLTGGVVTERGVVPPEAITSIAEEMETLRDWE